MFTAHFAILLTMLVAPALQDSAKLEGKWICVKAERDGQSTDAPIGSTIEFKEGKVTIRESKAETAENGTFKVDDSKSPKHLTLFPEDPGKAGAKEFLCVYEIKDGQLSICMSGPGADRPTEVSTSPDSMRMLLTFKADPTAAK